MKKTKYFAKKKMKEYMIVAYAKHSVATPYSYCSLSFISRPVNCNSFSFLGRYFSNFNSWVLFFYFSFVCCFFLASAKGTNDIANCVRHRFGWSQNKSSIDANRDKMIIDRSYKFWLMHTNINTLSTTMVMKKRDEKRTKKKHCSESTIARLNISAVW